MDATTSPLFEGRYTKVFLAGAGPPKESVANASQLFAVDRSYLSTRIGKLPPKRLEEILASIDVVLGR